MWRRRPEYRQWEKAVRLKWGNVCAVTGLEINGDLHHLDSGVEGMYDPIPLWAPLHVTFHKKYGYKRFTKRDFLVFLQDHDKELQELLEAFDMLISSQGQQECWQGSETRVYDPGRIMRLHERLASQTP